MHALKQIKIQLLLQKFYDNYDDAFRDASAGRIIGFILFASNFTESLTLFNDDLDYNTDNGVIQVFLDQTDLQKTTFMQKKLYDTYEKFTGSLMTSCDRAKRAGSIPIVFEASFGDMNFDMKTTLVPGFVVGYVERSLTKQLKTTRKIFLELFLRLLRTSHL